MRSHSGAMSSGRKCPPDDEFRAHSLTSCKPHSPCFEGCRFDPGQSAKPHLLLDVFADSEKGKIEWKLWHELNKINPL